MAASEYSRWTGLAGALFVAEFRSGVEVDQPPAGRGLIASRSSLVQEVTLRKSPQEVLVLALGNAMNITGIDLHALKVPVARLPGGAKNEASRPMPGSCRVR